MVTDESSDPSGDDGVDHPIDVEAQEASDASQPSDPSDRIREGDDPKFEVRGHTVSINEWHALVLGVLLSMGVGVAYHVGGYEQWALGAAALLGGYAVLGKAMLRRVPHVDESASKTMVMRTIRREPWYFLATFTPIVAVALVVVRVV